MSLDSIFSLLAVILGGAGFTSRMLCSIPSQRYWRTFKVILSITFGISIWSIGYACVLTNFGTNPTAMLLKDIFLTIAGTFLLIRSSTHQTILQSTGRENFLQKTPVWLWILFIASVVLATLIFISQSMQLPDGAWDAWCIWNLKARFFHRGGVDFKNAFSPEIRWSNPDYPLLLPGLVAQLWNLMGNESPVAPAMVGWTFAALITSTLVVSLAVLRGMTSGLSAGILLLSTPLFIRASSSQYGDIPVTTFAFTTTVLTALALERFKKFQPQLLLLAGFTASLAIWSKNEGYMHTLFLGMGLLLAHRSSRTPYPVRFQHLLYFAGGFAPLFLALIYYKWKCTPPNYPMSLVFLDDLLHRFLDLKRYRTIILMSASLLGGFGLWNALPLGLPLLLIFKRKHPAPDSAQILGSVLLLTLSGIFMVYVFTPYHLMWHILTSMNRVLIQVWPAAIFIVFLMVFPPMNET